MPVQLSQSAFDSGWRGIEKSTPQLVNSAELNEFLRAYFYNDLSFRQLWTEPLLDGCILMLIPAFLAFTLKGELALEWKELRRTVKKPESMADYQWDLPTHPRGIKRLMHEYMGFLDWLRSLLSQGAHSVLQLSRNDKPDRVSTAGAKSSDKALLSTAVRQTDKRPGQQPKAQPSNPPKIPTQSQSIFPQTARVRSANEDAKPWNESQWID